MSGEDIGRIETAINNLSGAFTEQTGAFRELKGEMKNEFLHARTQRDELFAFQHKVEASGCEKGIENKEDIAGLRRYMIWGGVVLVAILTSILGLEKIIGVLQ